MSTTASSVPGSAKTDPPEVKQSDAVKEATTLKEHGFPANTPDGQILVSRNVDKDGNIILEGEDGNYEVSDDPHILQPEGTADAEAKKAAADEPKAKSSKSE